MIKNDSFIYQLLPIESMSYTKYCTCEIEGCERALFWDETGLSCFGGHKQIKRFEK